jgi:hypothetical protein
VAQIVRPTSDVTTGSWGTTPLFSKVNDQSDATVITSPAAATECELALGDPTAPSVDTGHILTVRCYATGSGAGEKLTHYLYQGTTLIATSAANTISRGSGSIADYSYTLTTGEAALITDYTDLRIRMARTTGGGGETITVAECWLEVPDASATFNGVASLDAVATIQASGIVEAPAVERAASLDAVATIQASGTVVSGGPNPRQVQNLVATAVSQTQIDLTWDAASLPVPQVYDIERDSVVFLEDHTATSYSDTGLTANTLYTYRVRAVDGYDIYVDEYVELY